jgi:hypothetical protein
MLVLPTRSILPLLLAALSLAAAHAASPPLVVHEWGTFTSFQDAQGRTLVGINVDDEPVPGFVHRLRDYEAFNTASLPASWSQGAPRCYPGVTMRLETPVLYFYPPPDWQATPFDVRATFNGGWLTEFYPAAATGGMNIEAAVDKQAQGSLFWSALRLDPDAASLKPATDSHVWLAPREVRAALVVSDEAKEAEKYLFYRGVGNLDAPIVVRQVRDTLHISLRDGAGLDRLPHLWVVEVLPDKLVRHLDVEPAGHSVTIVPFPKTLDSRKSTLDDLKREMSGALTREGLFADEAAAMLATWRLSYFESEGLRVFFLLPQRWTEARLPLSISTPSAITRVMVGRVELVTERQREILRRLQAIPDDALPDGVPLYAQNVEALRMVKEGGKSHSELYRAVGREVPESLLLYESLGRFRDALLAHEWHGEIDAARRARYERIIVLYSACFVDPRGTPPPATPAKPGAPS